jgi:MFS family permease
VRVVDRALERALPAKLGTSFRWLLGAVVVGNLGDGILLAAGPLLVASETRDPLLVASSFFLQQLPWLLFGVFAGAYVDRLDRRLIVAVCDSLRALVLVGLTLVIVTDVVSIGIVLAAMFALGTAETVSDIAGQTLVPSVVDKPHLGIANARVTGAGFIVANQLAGPPIGAFLFALARPIPFSATAFCYLVGAVLVSRIVLRPRVRPAEERPVLEEIKEGVRWLWGHRPMRTLAITIVSFNVTFGAAWGVLVLYSQEQLGMSKAGFGLLTTASALGGLVATSAYGWLEANVGMANLMRIGLVLETLTHLALALTTTAWVALVVMFAFGAHAFVWGTTSTTVRQRAVPEELQGRVGSVYMIGVIGGMLVGTPIGGVLARHWGITAPFWFGFVGSAVLVALLWRSFGNIVHDTGQDAVTSS